MKVLLTFLFALYAALAPASIVSADWTGSDVVAAVHVSEGGDCACCDAADAAFFSCAVHCYAALAPSAPAAAPGIASGNAFIDGETAGKGLSLRPLAPPPRAQAQRVI